MSQGLKSNQEDIGPYFKPQRDMTLKNGNTANSTSVSWRRSSPDPPGPGTPEGLQVGPELPRINPTYFHFFLFVLCFQRGGKGVMLFIAKMKYNVKFTC